jgi:xanthine dehydrogenase YagS FAD-binding subunit
MSGELLPELTPSSMPEFKYIAPKTVTQAISALGAFGRRAKIIAGGSDLLHLMKRDSLVPLPDVIVDIKGIEELRSLEFNADQGLTLGSLVTIATIENDTVVASNYPLLSQAASDISSPQVRNVATVGGALSQQVWCSFLRNGLKCWRAGGSICYATQDGADNRYYQSIMGGNDCYAVHPSDLAVALEALDASVVISGPYGTKTVRIDEFLPGNVKVDGVLQSHILAPTELVTSVRLPPQPSGARYMYLKTRIRNVFDFAIASVAVALTVGSGTITSSRVVFGGIAPAPYRDLAVERRLDGGAVTSIGVEDVSAVALSAATPLQNNGYKVDVAKGLLKEALAQLLV